MNYQPTFLLLRFSVPITPTKGGETERIFRGHLSGGRLSLMQHTSSNATFGQLRPILAIQKHSFLPY
jgi:hypothetical protein